MSRLFICGITCGSEIDKIKELVERTKDSVDGYVWTVDSQSIGSIELIDFLRANKKHGEIIGHPWQNAHDWQANEWLHCGALQDGDWVWMFDSSESPSDEWLSTIRSNIEFLEKNNCIATYASGRPYLFKYNEYLFFQGTPHWGLYGFFTGRALSITDEEKNKLIINKRDLNPAKHYQQHDTKYYLYGRSNIIDAFYGKYGQQVIQNHEGLRRWFRWNLEQRTGIKPSLKALDFLLQNKRLTDDEIQTIEMEFCLSEYYRRTVLKQDFMKDIVPKREKWSFKYFLQFEDGFYDPNYLGTRLVYDKQLKNK
jgi:hypothetical protein